MARPANQLRKRLHTFLTNSEVICLYIAYRDGVSNHDIADYFGVSYNSIATIINRVEQEARRRGYDVKSCVRQNTCRSGSANVSRDKLNHDIYDDVLANPVVDDYAKYDGTEYKLHVPKGGGGSYDDYDA